MLKNFKQILKNLEFLQLNHFFKKNYIISGISISLLTLSPTLSIAWLFFTNMYLIYLNGLNLRDIWKVWIPTFTCWYLIFTLCMGDLVNDYIIVGENQTQELLRLILINNIWFENLCFQTVFLLHILSEKLNIIIYIPILPLIKLPKTFNAGNEDSERKATNNWWSRKPKPTQAETDFDVCKDLADKLKKARGTFYKTVKTQDKGRTVVAGEAWIPCVGNFTYCSGMPPSSAKHIDPGNKIPNTENSTPK